MPAAKNTLPLAIVALVLVVGGGAGLEYLTPKPSQPVIQMVDSTKTSLNLLADQLKQATQSYIATTSTAQVATAFVATSRTQNNHQVIDRQFGPDGALQFEHIETGTAVTDLTHTDTHVDTQVHHTIAEHVTEKSQTHLEKHAIVETLHTLTVTPARPDTGFSVGLIATPAGAGPALAWEVFKLGPVHARVLGGLVTNGHTLGPRAGVVVSGQVLPQVDLGLGVVLAPGSQEPLAYPVLGLAGVAPVITLQYRF